ncbi:hypothetical protein FDP41_011019 [Naegleria fowleri]|uniref:Uncharacterized protein n=1 Tax=Naegleria fowleri TaxID=5763 RepID=A0A6A5C7D8_NAEFO|nr:uncharacterized protein FDP41_011019 [Naegleria fowleri]KAF0983041.1 hypothetical protein FDP41_011019 [Naegleria fowleri]
MTRHEHKPKHSPYQYIKKNSQLGVAVGWAEDIDSTTKGYSATIPIALIWKKLQTTEDDDERVDSETIEKSHNYILTNFNHFCDDNEKEHKRVNLAKHYRPCYLLVVLREPWKRNSYVSNGWIGLLKLNKLGFRMDTLNQRLHILGKTSVYFPLSIFINEWTKEYFNFFMLGTQSNVNVMFEINQECLTESKLQIERMKQDEFVYCSFKGQVFWPTIGSSKRCWTFTNKYYYEELQLRRIYLKDNFQLAEEKKWSIKLPLTNKDQFMYLEYQHLNENEQNDVIERYLLVSVSQSKRWIHSLLQMQLGESQAFLTPTNFLNFDKLFNNDIQRHAKNNVKLLSHCKLTNSKYLIMCWLITSKQGHTRYKLKSFQDLFIHSTAWMLIDFESKLVKRVFPRVYRLSKKINEDGFKQVSSKKKLYSGKRLPKKSYFQDGDLNGGYSDVHLLQLIRTKNDTNSPCEEEDVVPEERNDIMLFGTNSKKDIQTIAFRPFLSNPDLFQVMVFFTSDVVTDCRKDVCHSSDYGKMFRFYFKLRDECSTRLTSTFKHYHDITLVTLQ